MAAAHLLRYYADERAGTAYRGAGEIHCLLFRPAAPAGNPYWPAPRAYLVGLCAISLSHACSNPYDRLLGLNCPKTWRPERPPVAE
jgi:hypothetical protein